MVDKPAVLYRSEPSAKRQAYDAYQRDLCHAAANYITALFDQDAVTGHSAPEAAGKLASFVTRVVLAGSIPPPILLAALVYLSRLKARYPLSTGASGARLFLTALVLGQKILQDGPYSNWTWVRLVRGHYSLSELACMERELLAFLAWDVAVEVDQLLAVEDLVMTYYRFAQQPAPRMSPSLAKRSNVSFPSVTTSISSDLALGDASGSACTPPTAQAVSIPLSVPKPLSTPPKTPIVCLTSSPRPQVGQVAALPAVGSLQPIIDGTPASDGRKHQRHRRTAYHSRADPSTPDAARKTSITRTAVALPSAVSRSTDRLRVLSSYRPPAPASPLARPIVASRSSSALSSLHTTAAASPAASLAVNFSRPMSRACSAANVARLGVASHDVPRPAGRPRLTGLHASRDEVASGGSSSSSSSSSSALSSALPSPAEGKHDSHQVKPNAFGASAKVGGMFSFGLLRGWRSASQPITAA